MMKLKSLAWRRAVDGMLRLGSALAALLALAALGWIIYMVAAKGMGAMSVAFFTERATPPGIPGGGVGHAIAGSLLITALAVIGGVPLGLLAGVYLSEFGKGSKTAHAIRFLANVLMGIPSIIVGLFAYGVLVVPMGRFSAWAGALALAIIMLPVVARTAEDMLNLVPDTLRESALALGAPRWKVSLGVVFRAARSGLITGSVLAVARVSGETAPLLFTALNSPYWPESPGQPTANLTVTIWNYAMSPYADWQQAAWGASLLIMVLVLFTTIFTRWSFREAKR